MRISRDMLKVGRILSQDDDFAVIEVGKTDKVTFHLQQDDEGETVGGDQFLTFLFVRSDGDGSMETWDPFVGEE